LVTILLFFADNTGQAALPGHVEQVRLFAPKDACPAFGNAYWFLAVCKPNPWTKNRFERLFAKHLSKGNLLKLNLNNLFIGQFFRVEQSDGH
jgi:hypothetical protein